METRDNEKTGIRRLWTAMKRALCSVWLVPTLCFAAALVAGITSDRLNSLYQLTQMQGKVLGRALDAGIISLPILLAWLIVCCSLDKGWSRRGQRLLVAVPVGVVSLLIVFNAFAKCLLWQGDDAASDWEVPAGVAFEVPDNLSVGETAPDIVKHLAGETGRHVPEGDLPAQIKDLVQQHPALAAPKEPHLHLIEGERPGMYHLTLWLPKNARTDGRFEIKACEYNTGKRLSTTFTPLKGESGIEQENARVLANPDFFVFTGMPGQYYGSRWQVWFVSKQGERQLVCEQLLLMQGYENPK